MRRDWNARAAEDAEYYVRTPDESGAGFDESGRLNYAQQIQPLLDLLLDERPPSVCRAVEIGCGLGRITRPLAERFAEVHAVDISPEMIARARERLRDCANVTLHLGSGEDLAGLPEAYFDFAFSYIVFQHIPARAIIESYVRDAARVLRAGGAFHFQVNGWSAWDYRRQAKDTWLGESFSLPEVLTLLERAGLQPLRCTGGGTQEMWITARRPRDLREASPDLLRRELAERRGWEQNLAAELSRLDVEPPELEKLRAELAERTAWAQGLERDLAVARADLESQQRGWEAELAKSLSALADVQREFDERTVWTRGLEAALEQARTDLAELQREFDERTAWAKSLEADLERTRADFASLQKAFDERTAWALEMRDELERRKP